MTGSVVHQAYTGDGPGAAIEIGSTPIKSVQVSGTFVADWAVELRNGTTWFEALSGNAPSLQNIDLDALEVRVVISNYVSGTVEVDWFQYWS